MTLAADRIFAKGKQRSVTSMALKWLEQEPLFLDTETTGLDLEAEIVDICIADFNGAILIDTLVKPFAPIPEGATDVHGISNEMVSSARIWPEIWPEIREILSGRLVCIYNASYDMRLIKQTHRHFNMGWVSPGARAACIMKLYAIYYGEWSEHYGSYRWQSLEKAGKQCGIELQNTHRAKDDTLLAREVLLYLASEGP